MRSNRSITHTQTGESVAHEHKIDGEAASCHSLQSVPGRQKGHSTSQKVVDEVATGEDSAGKWA